MPLFYHPLFVCLSPYYPLPSLHATRPSRSTAMTPEYLLLTNLFVSGCNSMRCFFLGGKVLTGKMMSSFWVVLSQDLLLLVCLLKTKQWIYFILLTQIISFCTLVTPNARWGRSWGRRAYPEGNRPRVVPLDGHRWEILFQRSVIEPRDV